jgi:hypothetical protein
MSIILELDDLYLPANKSIDEKFFEGLGTRYLEITNDPDDIGDLLSRPPREVLEQAVGSMFINGVRDVTSGWYLERDDILDIYSSILDKQKKRKYFIMFSGPDGGLL